MDYQKIQSETAGAVTIIRLNDPATLNAITNPMIEELDHAVQQAGTISRALVLTGAGRAFCAGANLAGGALPRGDADADYGATLETHINPLMQRLRRLPIPWVSAVRGAAAGVGCSLALAADLSVASEGAYFLLAFARIGLVPDGGSSWLLTRAAGRARAMELMLLAERLPASRAFEWGLINRLTSEDELESTALALAQTLAAGPTRSLAMIRELAWAAADQDWDHMLARERMMQRDAGATADCREGIAAFQQKRAARFTGA